MMENKQEIIFKNSVGKKVNEVCLVRHKLHRAD